MARIELFVIGGSAGALEALRRIVSDLPRPFPSAICVVMHTSPDSPGLIPEILNDAGPLTFQHAKDGDALTPGCIFVAPPDHHLLVNRERRLMLGRGPKENRFRPAIDPLFRSASLALDGHVGGVILSGGLDDGIAGLVTIKRRGGATIVQSPDNALVTSMPKAALRAVEADAVRSADGIAEVMTAFAQSYAAKRTAEVAMGEDLDKEVSVAAGGESHPGDVLKLGAPSLLTCPDCNGSLVHVRDSVPPRFRCHTGHAYTLESLIGAIHERVEDSLWNAVRTLEEYAIVLEHAADHGSDEPTYQRRALQQAKDAHRRARLVREAVNPDR